MKISEYLVGVKNIYAKQGRTFALNMPAPAASIGSKEGRLGQDLPSELKELWSLANGGAYGDPVFAVPNSNIPYDLLSVGDCVEQHDSLSRRAHQYEGYKDPQPRDPRIAKGWFSEGWFPFGDFAGLLLILDYSPSSSGTRGQVISFSHDPDEMEFVASSFREFLVKSLGQLAVCADELLQE